MSDSRSATVVVKVRPEVRDWLARVAGEQFRTISAEVSMRLEADYRRATQPQAKAAGEAT